MDAKLINEIGSLAYTTNFFAGSIKSIDDGVKVHSYNPSTGYSTDNQEEIRNDNLETFIRVAKRLKDLLNTIEL